MELTSCIATPRATGERMAKTLSREPRNPACSRFDGAVSWYAVLVYCLTFPEKGSIVRALWFIFSWPDDRPVSSFATQGFSGISSSNWNLGWEVLGFFVFVCLLLAPSGALNGPLFHYMSVKSILEFSSIPKVALSFWSIINTTTIKYMTERIAFQRGTFN